jgi:hypothetical protein
MSNGIVERRFPYHYLRYYGRITPAEEQAQASRDEDLTHTIILAHPRLRVLHAFQEKIEMVLKTDCGDADGGVEIGPGATAFLFRYLLPTHLRKNWRAFDVSQAVVDSARRAIWGCTLATPDIEVGSAYEMENLSLEGVMLIMALSAFDSMGHLELAMQQAYNILGDGGHLVLIQDVLPFDKMIFIREARKRILTDSTDDLLFETVSEKNHSLINVFANGNKQFSMDYYHNEVLAAAESLGFIVRRHAFLEHETVGHYCPELFHVPYHVSGPVNSFRWQFSRLEQSYERSLPENLAIEAVSLYVSVFEKPAGAPDIEYFPVESCHSPLACWQVSNEGKFHLDKQYGGPTDCYAGTGPFSWRPVLATAARLKVEGLEPCAKCASHFR